MSNPAPTPSPASEYGARFRAWDLTAACTFLGVAVLVLILGYIAWRGVSSLSLEFLIDTPKPVGEGGGIGNAILGKLVLLALASS